MEKSCYGKKANRGEQAENMILHFINGNLQLDECTAVSSEVQGYKATIYSNEPIGQIIGSDVIIGYNEDQQVWVEVKTSDGSNFEWNCWENKTEVTVLLYILLYEREYLLFCNNEDFFCYLIMPQEDPRRDYNGRIPNEHLNTTYLVLDKLLTLTNQFAFKCVPKFAGGTKWSR